jgi:hypothetical protein
MDTDNTQLFVYADRTRHVYINTGKQIRSGWGGNGWYRQDSVIYRGVYIGFLQTRRAAGKGCRIDTWTHEPSDAPDGGYCVMGNQWPWLITRYRDRGGIFPILRGDFVRFKGLALHGYVDRRGELVHGRQLNLPGFMIWTTPDCTGDQQFIPAVDAEIVWTKEEMEAQCVQYAR